MATRTAEYAAANLTRLKFTDVLDGLRGLENPPEKARMLHGLATLCQDRARRDGGMDFIPLSYDALAEATAVKNSLPVDQRDHAARADARSNVELLLANDALWEILSAPRGFGLL